MKVHVIIDMQPYFFDNDNFSKLLRDRIIKYIKNNVDGTYIILRFADCGETMKSIIRSFTSKHTFVELEKGTDSGANQIIHALKKKNINLKEVEYSIMGVNTDYCVAATIRELLKEKALKSLKVHNSMIGNAWDGVIGDPNLCIQFIKGSFVKTRVIKEKQFQIVD